MAVFNGIGRFLGNAEGIDGGAEIEDLFFRDAGSPGGCINISRRGRSQVPPQENGSRKQQP